MRILASLSMVMLAVTGARAGQVFAVDAAAQEIVRFDAATGTRLGAVPTPALASGNADGLAVSGSSLFFVNANGSNVIYEIDAATGSNINSFPAPLAAGGTDGLAVVDGLLFSLDAAADTVFKIDPADGSVVDSCVTGLGAAGGLAGEDGRLFVLLGLVQVAELDPVDCSVVGGPFALPDFMFGLGFDGQFLYGSGLQNQLVYTIDPATGVVLGSFDPGFAASGMAASADAPGGEDPGHVGVLIDVKPGNCQNNLNPRSRGVVMVLLMGSDELDLAQVDTETVNILGIEPMDWFWGDQGGAGDCGNPLPDGYLDVRLKYSAAALLDALLNGSESTSIEGEFMLQLEGGLVDGTLFVGEDSVHVHTPAPRAVARTGTAHESGETAPPAENRQGRRLGRR